MNLYFVTTNIKKKLEVEACLKLPIDQICIDIDEIQGTKEEIAKDKLKKALIGNEEKIIIIDDTAIELKALNGFPGPYGKDFLKIGYDCIENLVSKIGRETILSTVLGLGYYKNGKPVYELFEGCIEGEIIKKDFDKDKCWEFDGVFRPLGQEKVYGEMSFEGKNALSHRAIACKKLKEYLIKNKMV
jgi:non-canonical purine NTP pyrophosphatase (RdgB/HAM1 family)